MPKLSPGLYDLLISEEVAAELGDIEEDLKQTGMLDPGTSHEAIARTLHTRLLHALQSISSKDRLAHQLALANAVLQLLSKSRDSGTRASDQFPSGTQRLLEILEPVEPPARPLALVRPHVPLASSDLLVNARHDLSLGPEIGREIVSADRVDLLCSFVKWSGLRIVDDALAAMLARRPGQVRVLTTTYMGATERRALDRLVELGAQVRVSYDSSRTRLHAKSWLFRRESGFSTGYVGSSNLSAAAMLDGLEWNVRLSQVDNPAILAKFNAAFEQYWSDPEFRAYDSKEFDEALTSDRRQRASPYLRFDLQPKPHQRQILDELEAERAYGHNRNLVVAATGTGKTVVAALDYKRLRDQLDRARLLFVAHRREILSQSRVTFQVALRDAAFGEMLGDGERPLHWQHVFANIQSLTEAQLAEIAPDHFDVVIIDEFHHAAALSYDRLLQHVRPRVLLGLTATPERADGRSVLHWFDGRIASQTRLWDALDQGLLCPFQYFGIGGAPDARAVKWTRGKYDRAALSNVYTADHMFALRVIQQIDAKVRDIRTMRALGFCIDLPHAAFMTERFESSGVRAAMLSGESSSRERDVQLAKLRAGELNIIFTVDLFNEGIDAPEVDTIVLLRPTESATIFLQQLGRGLRHAEGKACCTVLDFIGHGNRRFRFDARYRAIVGGTRKFVESQVADGFPSLPSGCVIVFDEIARDAVLENIRASLGIGKQGLVEDLREMARTGNEPTMREFLLQTETELEDIYTKEWGWTALRRKAGLHEGGTSAFDHIVERALGRMLHLDDDRLEAFARLLESESPPVGDSKDVYQRLLFVLLGNVRTPYDRLDDTWGQLWARPWLRAELREVMTMLQDRRRKKPLPLAEPLADLVLRVHGTYSRDEVFAAFDERSKKNTVKRTQGGIYNVRSRKTELLFVELDKSDKDYTPTTLYNDYPVTAERFHWESQASCHEGTPSGRRYLAARPGGEQNILLFVRRRRHDERGMTSPYLLLGLCDIVEHRGARPMQVEWKLRVPMPADFYQDTKIVGG